MFEEALGGGGASRTSTAKNSSPNIAAKIGGGDPSHTLTAEKLIPETIGIMGDSQQFNVVYETRKEINKYVLKADKVKATLLHLTIDENFGRPKHYKTKKI